MHASWKKPITSFAPSLLTGACRKRSTAWQPRAARHWSDISIIWKHLSAPQERVSGKKFAASLYAAKLFADCPPRRRKNMLVQQFNIQKIPAVAPATTE